MAEEMSKSAKKRANKKARDAAGGAPEEPEPPAPAPKATPKQAAAKPKAKAEPEPPPAPKAEAKAKAKGKAKAEPAPAPEPKAAGKAKAAAPAPAAEVPAKAKSEAKAKAKGKAKPKPEEEQKPKQVEGLPPVVMDDGGGGDWEVSTGVSKKAQKRKEKADEAKAAEKAAEKAAKSQNVPGAAAAAAPGKAQGKAGAKAAEMTHVAKAAAAIAEVTKAAKEAKDKQATQPPGSATAAAAAPEAADPNLTTDTVKIDASKIGRIIGPKGSNIALIKEKTGVKTIDTAGDVCTIVGQPDAVALAKHAITELVEKGFMSLSFEDFKEDGVMVLPTMFPSLIGERGSIIQVIKKEAQVEIDIPSVPKNGPAGKKYKVTLAGSNAGVEKAKEIIDSIVAFGYHEVTHPGYTHQALEVEEWKYRFLIGKGGSEMRHIQNNYKVKVNIPRDTSGGNDKVVVLGEKTDVERAVKYIEKVLYEAEQPKGRGAPEKAEGDWGDAEDPVEDWMKPYMYNRGGRR